MATTPARLVSLKILSLITLSSDILVPSFGWKWENACDSRIAGDQQQYTRHHYL